jgi:hypothetical protein
MGKSLNRQQKVDTTIEVLKDILITQLGIAGVPQQDIRKIVGCDINRVSAIVRHVKAAERSELTAAK